MEYEIVNSYIYDGKSSFIKACDWLSKPLRGALGGRTITCSSGDVEQNNRIKAILLCCLLIPLIVGSVALLCKRITKEYKVINLLPTQEYPEAYVSMWLLSDQPFTYPYFPRLPAPGDEAIISEKFVSDFVAHLFDLFHSDQTLNSMIICINDEDEVCVKQGHILHPLTQVLECINWENLDEQWGVIDQERIQLYLQNSLLFGRLQDPLDAPESPFEHSNPFIRLYTSCDFYAIVNPLLRNGKMRIGRLFFATEATNEKFTQNDPETVFRITKEVLFVSLMMAGSLNALPEEFQENRPSMRIAHVPKAVMELMTEGNIISERGFLSTSAGGGYAGGGPCDESSVRVKYIIRPKNGKRVSEFSDLQENEVLFRPFTQFKVLKRSGDEVSGFRIEMEEN